MYGGKNFHIPGLPRGATVEEVLEHYRQYHRQHGNDFDPLVQSTLLIQAGHYRQGMVFALRVQTPSAIEEPPESVDKEMAKAAYFAAYDRARPLLEQAALEIEGVVEGSKTMAAYEMGAEMLRSDPNW